VLVISLGLYATCLLVFVEENCLFGYIGLGSEGGGEACANEGGGGRQNSCERW
jgi:hypothetical protein